MSQLNIGFIQQDLKWEDKSYNLSLFEKRISDMKGVELIVLPEMFSTGFSMRPEVLAEKMSGPTIQWMKRVAGENKVILTGSIIIEEDGLFFNRLIWMLPNHQFGFYDKRHLFGFAGEHEHYSSGTKRLIASVNGWKINLQVCYDLRFPVWTRQQLQFTDNGDMVPEYDLLIYVANWPERRNHAWKTLLQARVIENQCYVLGVNRVGYDGNEIYHSGDSMIIDPMGTPLVHIEKIEATEILTLDKNTLDELRENLPFLKDADMFRML
ncbi:MAG: nitrilase family protein [Chitinophagaceae bacterium]